MDRIRKAIQAHKTLVSVLVLGFAVFINCFGFPIYNLSKDWSAVIVAEHVFIASLSALYIGGGLALLFPEKRYLCIAFIIIVSACVGMGCRFLLEWGEVSNTYNFTVPNISFHLIVFIVLTSLSWLYTMKFNQSER